MSSVVIYYFSGSGNSLFVARELRERLPGAILIPIVSLLEKEKIVAGAETVGIIFPVHAMTVPIPVKKFVKKLDLSPSQYVFAVATRGGTVSNAFTVIDRILAKSGRGLDMYCYVDMASNDPKFKDWRPETPKRMAEIESGARDKLDSLQKVILGREKYHEKDTTGKSFQFIFPFNILMEKVVQRCLLMVEMTGLNNYFYQDKKCAGCGTCEKVCSSGKIKMAGGKPVWRHDVKCFFCYACVNYCPKKAVQIKSKVYMKSYTELNERYSHPYATVNDLASQKLTIAPKNMADP